MADPRLALQGAQISPQNKEEPLYQAVQDSLHLLTNPGIEAGLSSLVFTEPIAQYLKSDDRKQDSPLLGMGVGDFTVGKMLGAFVPEDRGEALLNTALAGFGGARKGNYKLEHMSHPLSSHPSTGRRLESLGEENIPEKAWSRYGGAVDPTHKGKARVAYRVPKSTRIKREIQNEAAGAVEDMHSISSFSPETTMTERVRGAIYNTMPRVANDVVSGIKRYFLGQEEQ
jgi:hypothetical protein